MVDRMAEPRLMPTPNMTRVPQPMRFWASFQSMMPMPGSIIRVTAARVVVEVSKLWSTFSVDHRNSRMTERGIYHINLVYAVVQQFLRLVADVAAQEPSLYRMVNLVSQLTSLAQKLQGNRVDFTLYMVNIYGNAIP